MILKANYVVIDMASFLGKIQQDHREKVKELINETVMEYVLESENGPSVKLRLHIGCVTDTTSNKPGNFYESSGRDTSTVGGRQALLSQVEGSSHAF